MYAAVADIRNDCKFQDSHIVQGHAVIFNFFCRSLWTERPLLAYHLFPFPSSNGTAQREHEILRKKPFVSGAIFFCYNDYRTHVGDSGVGVLQQRVHGVVDAYGAQKPSYALLRNESGPIHELTVDNYPSHVLLHVRNADRLPSYILRAYTVRALYYEAGDIPVRRVQLKLPELTPGATATLQFDFEKTGPERIVFDVLRPTRYSAATLVWVR